MEAHGYHPCIVWLLWYPPIHISWNGSGTMRILISFCSAKILHSYQITSRDSYNYSKPDSVMLSAVVARLGYSSLKPMQSKVICSILDGDDVFAVLPTGYGKTLCYILACHLLLMQTMAWICRRIVVSPLKSILEDQVS